MKRQATSAVLFVVVVTLIASAAPVLSQSWNSTVQMSLAANPSGDWSYGFIEKDGRFHLYNSTFDDGNGIKGWVMNANPDIAGNILVNISGSPIDRYGVRWEIGQVAVQPGLGGQKPVLRWTAPANVIVQIAATFSSQCYSTAAKIAVLKNAAVLDESAVDGFVGSGVAAEGQKGAFPARVYSSAIAVIKGETIDFAVDNDGPWKLNQTGIVANISVVTAGKESGLALGKSQWLRPEDVVSAGDAPKVTTSTKATSQTETGKG